MISDGHGVPVCIWAIPMGSGIWPAWPGANRSHTESHITSQGQMSKEIRLRLLANTRMPNKIDSSCSSGGGWWRFVHHAFLHQGLQPDQKLCRPKISCAMLFKVATSFLHMSCHLLASSQTYLDIAASASCTLYCMSHIK